MSSPSAALIWEIWRKNRWGFAALVILFGVGFGFALHVNHLRAEVTRIENEIRFSEQIIDASQILPSSPTGLVPRLVRFKLGRGLTSRQGTIARILEDTDNLKQPSNGVLLDRSSRETVFAGYVDYVPDPKAKVIYEGLFSSNDQLVWSLDSKNAHANAIQISLGNKVLFEGLVPINSIATQPSELNQFSEVDLSWGFLDEVKKGASPHQANLEVSQRENQNSEVSPIPEQLDLGKPQRHYVLLIPRNPIGHEEVAVAWMKAETWRELGLTWSITLMLFSVLVVFGIFSCAEPSSAFGFTGIPPRRFALPVRTETLVFWPVILGCSTVLVVYFAWIRVVITDLLPNRLRIPELYLSSLLLAGMTVFQALVWGLSSFPRIRMWLVSFLVLGILPLAGYAVGMERATIGGLSSAWMFQQSTLTAVFVVVWLAGIAAAVAVVRLERCGTWAGWRLMADRIPRIGAIFPRSLTLRSPLRALMWMEWTRNFRLPLLIWALAVAIIYGSVLIAVNLGMLSFGEPIDGLAVRGNLGSLPLAPDILWLLMIFGGFGGIAVIGSLGARDAGANRLAFSSFSATRPVSVGSLLTAKLAAGIVAWLLTSGTLCCGYLTVAYNLGEDPRQPAALLICLILVISLNLITGILPINLSGRLQGFPWSLLPLLVIFLGLMNLVLWFERRPQWSETLLLLLYCLLAIKLGTAYWGFRRAIQLRLATVRFVAGCVFLWLLGTVTLETLAWTASERRAPYEWFYGVFSDSTFWVPLVLLAVPLARLALSPHALAVNRHR